MSGKDFGGIMLLRDSAGRSLSIRGQFTVRPAPAETDAITNQDGSVDRVVTPVAPGADLTFADGTVNAADLMDIRGRPNVTIVEEFTGVTHLFTRAFYTGSPEVNRINGEVTGIRLVAESYRRR